MEANKNEKFNLLINGIDISSYEYIDMAKSSNEAEKMLEKVYEKKIDSVAEFCFGIGGSLH